MRPTEELKAEHQGILQVLKVMEKASEKITSDEGVPVEHLKQVMEFLQVFVDKCHHGKEEGILFPAMVAVGVPIQGGPIGMMLTEHEMGRKLVKDMTDLIRSHENGNEGSLLVFTNPALQYINLLRSHIWKEETVVFPLADEKLPDEKQQQMERDFQRLEEEKIGPGKHEAFHKMIDTLSAIYA